MNTLDKYLLKLQKIPTKEKIFLLQNLSIAVKSGLPLAEALEGMSEQTKNKKLRAILEESSSKIKKGKSFAQSLEKYKNDFGEMFVNMINAGEISGSLDKVLKELYKQHKKDYELKSKIKGALIYPCVILIAMTLIGFFMVFFVLPNITKMFEELDAELPFATRALINFSNFTQNNGLLLAALGLTFLFVIYRLLKTAKGKYIRDYVLLKTPIFGKIIIQINLARISRSLSSLMKTDIDIINALYITEKVIGNHIYKKTIADFSQAIQKGKRLDELMKKYPKLYSMTFTQMVATGENTGSLDKILSDVASFYEEDVSRTMDSLPTMIEPLLMIMMGLAVAGIALAIMMPIYSLTENF